MAVVSPFEGLINGVLQGHAIATQLHQQAMQDEAFQRAKVREDEESQMRDLQNSMAIRGAGRPVVGNAVEETAPGVVEKITRQMTPGGTPAKLDDGSYGVGSIDDLPQTRTSLTPGIENVTTMRPVDRSRLLKYKNRAGETIQVEQYSPQDLLSQQLAHTQAMNQVTAEGAAQAEDIKSRADQTRLEGDRQRFGVQVPDILVQAGLARPGEKRTLKELGSLIPEAQKILSPEYKEVAPGASLVAAPRPAVNTPAPAVPNSPAAAPPDAAATPANPTNPLATAAAPGQQARTDFITRAKAAGQPQAAQVLFTSPDKPTGDLEKVWLPAFAAKRGKTVGTLSPDETLQGVQEYAQRSKDPTTLALAHALTQAHLDDVTARRSTTPMAIDPGTREFKVAQDLAYGRLTMQQFRSLYSYSRDMNKKLDIYDKASELNPNFNPAAFESGFKFASNPKTQQQLAALDNVIAGVPDLLKFSDAASRTGITSLNKLVNKGGIAIGGKTYSNFHAAQIGFADELSGALGFGGATDMSKQMGFDMTNGNLSPENFASAIQNVVVPFIQRKKGTMLKQMGVYGGPGMNPAAGPAEAPNGAAGSGAAPAFKVGDTVMYKGAPHKVTGFNGAKLLLDGNQ